MRKRERKRVCECECESERERERGSERAQYQVRAGQVVSTINTVDLKED